MALLDLLLLINLFLFHIPQEGNPQYSFTQDTLKIIEKVYLHIDRENYSPGEDLWFKAYLVDGTDKNLSEHSNDLHVDLISPDLTIIESHIVRLSGGLGNGDFRLPVKAASGRYQIRAYTNYMRNFGEEMFFKKYFTIINADNPNFDSYDSTIYVSNKPDITFFPEGGSLVDDVTSLIGFKAADATGKGCEITGKVYSSHGDTVASFKSTFKGMGTFNLTPSHGEVYYSIIYDNNGDTARSQIPKSMETGTVLHVSEIQPGELDLAIRTNMETLPILTGHDLSLSISVHNTILKTIFFKVKSLNNHMALRTGEFPDGIVSLTVSDFEGKPFCERLAFIHNNDDEKLTIKTDKPVYATRDSVSVNISLSGSSVNGQDAFLSLSASNAISEDGSDLDPSNISSWFLLESDVRGEIEEPLYYFDRSKPNRLKNLDILLLTQGWRDFKWKYEDKYYQPENGFTLSGRVRRKFADKPLENSFVTLGLFKGKKPNLFMVPIDSSGRFLIKGVNITGKTSLIASVTNDKDKLKGWLTMDSIRYNPPEIESKKEYSRYFIRDIPVKVDKKSDEQTNGYLEYSESNNNLKKRYSLLDTIKIGQVIITPKLRFEPEIPRVQNEINLRTMFFDKEITVTPILEIYNTLGQLLGVRFHITYTESSGFKKPESTSGQSFLTTQLPGVSSCNHMTDPLTMLDGMEVKYDAISFIPVSWVERIDVLCPINGGLVWGERGDQGVVSILLKSDAYFSSPSIVYHSINTAILGYNEPRVYYSPKHHTSLEKDKKPDLRTTLFWEPNIELLNDKDISFSYFNSDNPSTVRIIVEGITKSGIPLVGSTEYKVNR